MPIIETKGAASSQGFGQFASTGEAVYIESVFQTWLYTGNGSTQTITNGIDLSTKGGLVWFKDRNVAASHRLFDTARGTGKTISSNLTSAQATDNTMLTAFNAAGFSLGTDSSGGVNENGNSYVSWTFREQPKFFDVVTYTGNGGTQTISHNLGSVPGCIIYKCTSTSNNWIVYHRSLGEDFYLQLNLTSASTYSTTVFDITAPTSTTFTVGSLSSGANVNGQTYVAYLFAHNAGGFGLTGTDNVISCGSFTNNSTVTLGYEPQFVIVKRTDNIGNWFIQDTMRGIPTGGFDALLFANSSDPEDNANDFIDLTATGFTTKYGNGTFIYIAIRRGPMKTPTTGTSVYTPQAVTKSGVVTTVTAGFPVDLTIEASRSHPFVDGLNSSAIDRLRGGDRVLITSGTASEYGSGNCSFASNTTFTDGWLNDNPNIYWMFRRAPGFFDVVCFTSTGSSTQAINHNLGVTPELIIEKVRNNTSDWAVQQIPANKYGSLNSTSAMSSWSSTGISAPTATVFSPAGFPAGRTEVAYLFASCPGVSKVGSYTGTGATLQIDCGFTGGARFVLIKRTDSTGSWYVWDSARGIVAGNDPYLLLNSTAAEVTNTDWVDTHSPGFELSNSAGNLVNVNGGTYIYLAIA